MKAAAPNGSVHVKLSTSKMIRDLLMFMHYGINDRTICLNNFLCFLLKHYFLLLLLFLVDLIISE